jgi:integrase
MMDKASLYALVRATTQAAQELKVADRIQAAQAVSKKTAETYKRTAARRMDLRSPDLGQLMDGVSARSWHATRAALVQVAALHYRHVRRACDEAQKAGNWERAEQAAVFASRALEVIRRVEAAERPQLDGKRATKRRSLPRSEDWQARIWDEATPTQRPAIAVLWASGCRPAEIEVGVDLIRRDRPDGRVLIELRVPGAKITEHSGQPMRCLVIDGNSAQGRALLDALDGRVSMTVQRGARRLNADFVDLRSKTGLRVSPYSMRHQASANLKAEFGPDKAEKVAEAMGHVTTRSQGRYGSTRQAQQGGSGVLAIEAVRPVKETRPGRAGPSIPRASGPSQQPS